jgi:hypothetical protein
MSDIDSAAKTAAMAEIQPVALKAAQEASAKAAPGKKALVYEMKLEQEWARLLPEAHRRHYSRLLTESLK